MAAVTTKGTKQDSTPTHEQNGTLDKGENGNKKQGPADSKQEPGDNKDGPEMDVSNRDSKEEKHSVAPEEVAKESVLSTENGNKEEPACELSEPVKSPVGGIPESSTETGESIVELKQEQREESASSPPSSDKTKSEESTEKTDRGVKRRASVEISSSDGEPLSRMDSEDRNRAGEQLEAGSLTSISSTLMDMESTASSGRSTPAMMNGHGPATATPSVGKGVAYTCCWDQCQLLFTTSPDLAEHIRGVHVDGQRGGVFVCLWKGCKVYNTPSTSQSWLQRHMVSHSGDKPFKCVVGGCNATFASQGGLARHVPTHFSSQNSNKLANQGKMKEDSPSKAGLNKRRKLKNKRRRSLLCSVPPARPHDFFDAQTMDAIRHRAICLNLATHIESLGNGHSVVFHSTVIARRKEDSGKVKVLLHWTPEDILPDVWVNESDRPQQKTKVVHLSQLPQDTHVLLDPNIYRMFF
ncbi:zinc finger protein AEBP2-like isoform X2 [Oncorhynchus nerka]|uniref:zinc finger protein AEBP2-like isoform X2 n=1 Tax=Oncorhynchus nerka TaxID=8023 RepID=UPI0031B850AC